MKKIKKLHLNAENLSKLRGGLIEVSRTYDYQPIDFNTLRGCKCDGAGIDYNVATNCSCSGGEVDLNYGKHCSCTEK